jgi:ribosomal protein S16
MTGTEEWISVYQDRWRWRRRDGRFIELIDAFDPEENVVGLFCIGEPS